MKIEPKDIRVSGHDVGPPYFIAMCAQVDVNDKGFDDWGFRFSKNVYAAAEKYKLSVGQSTYHTRVCVEGTFNSVEDAVSFTFEAMASPSAVDNGFILAPKLELSPLLHTPGTEIRLYVSHYSGLGKEKLAYYQKIRAKKAIGDSVLLRVGPDLPGDDHPRRNPIHRIVSD